MRDGEYTPIAPPNIVTFGLQTVSPPSPLYLQRDDQIGVQVISSQASEVITISGRLLRAVDGIVVPFNRTLPVVTAYVTKQLVINLAEGYLLSLVITGSASNMRGQTFVNAMIVRGFTSSFLSAGAASILIGDYCTTNQPVGWPGARVLNCLEGIGAQGILSPGNPAAGAEVSVSSVNFAYRNVTAMQLTLTCSATVATRIPVFLIGQSPSVLVPSVSPVTAGQTFHFYMGQGGSPYFDGFTEVYLPIPAKNFCETNGGKLLLTQTTALQAGDQWSAITIFYDEWVWIQ